MIVCREGWSAPVAGSEQCNRCGRTTLWDTVDSKTAVVCCRCGRESVGSSNWSCSHCGFGKFERPPGEPKSCSQFTEGSTMPEYRCGNCKDTGLVMRDVGDGKGLSVHVKTCPECLGVTGNPEHGIMRTDKLTWAEVKAEMVAQKAAFRAGDLVQLKSGGPAMTVQYYHAECDLVDVQWFRRAECMVGSFYSTMLRRVDETPPTAAYPTEGQVREAMG